MRREIEREICFCWTASGKLGSLPRSFDPSRAVEFLELLPSRYPRGTARVNVNEQSEAFAEVDRIRETLEAAATAAEAAEPVSRRLQQAARPTQQGENAAAAAVVEVMAYMWRDFVGRAPKPTAKRFIRVLEGAAKTLPSLVPSLGPLPSNLRNTSWPEQSKKALHRMARRPEWDRVDRYAKALQSPGIKVMTWDQLLERRRRGAEAQDDDIREAVSTMEQGGPEAIAAAFLLAYGYVRATGSMRAHYIALGFHPENAEAILARPTSTLED